MGLLASAAAESLPEKKANDNVLLFHAMMLVIAADGILEPSELITVESFFSTLPEFKGHSIQEISGQAQKVAMKYTSFKESINALADIQSEKVRRKCFVLATDLALSSGDVGEAEDQLLETMQRLFNLDDLFCKKVIEVLALKYAS